MAYYDPLIALWPSLTGTTQQKIDQANAKTQTGPTVPALFQPSHVLNAIVPADLAALTQMQVSQLTLVLSGSWVDASKGTTVRTTIQSMFAGKTQTLNNLGALVAPFDNPTISWCQGNGYPYSDLTGLLTLVDATNAGLV